MNNTKPEKTNEIDIIGLLRNILSNKKELLLFIIIGAIMGVVIAINTPKKYTANVILAPELSGGNGMTNNLSDIASMVGINLSNTGSSIDAIYPEIYPDVVSSSDFIIPLFDVMVKTENDSISKSYYNHLKNDTKIPFWSYPKIWLSKLFTAKQQDNNNNDTINIFKLTKEQDNICNSIRGNISCIVDKKTCVISISVTDLDKVVAATIADTIQSRLQQYITFYRTKKARSDVEYTEKLLAKAEKEYIESQKKYASFSDSNTDIVLEKVKIERDILENNMQLKYNAYNQLSQQLQITKAKVLEKTPVFTIVQSASVPTTASGTPRSFIVFAFILIGIVADCIWILYIRDSYMARKTK